MPDPVTPAPATVSRTGTPSGRVDVPGGHVSGPVGWVRGYWFSALVVVTIGFLVVAEISDGPDAAADWNWLMHTGAIVFLVALAAARAIPPAVPLAVRRIRLVDDEGVERAHGDEVLAALELVRRRCARIGAPVGLVLMGMFWLWAGGNRVWGNALFWLELAAAAGAGFIVGGFVAYGRLGHVLNTLGLRALAIPGHPDGAAGLRPVGALYLRQAMIIALIGVFAGVWWLLFPYVGHVRQLAPALSRDRAGLRRAGGGCAVPAPVVVPSPHAATADRSAAGGRRGCRLHRSGRRARSGGPSTTESAPLSRPSGSVPWIAGRPSTRCRPGRWTSRSADDLPGATSRC